MEFIGAGVPLVAFAHFGDQHVNAKLVTDGKAGVELYNQEASNPMDVDQNLSRLDPVFD
jgi:UDP:flavonoid glycosyltransferase YjiC (YdhE family)